MSEIRTRLLSRHELPLANKFYKVHQPSMRAHGDERVWLLQDESVLGAVRLKPIGDGHWLTGLYVVPQRRGEGLALRLLEDVLACHGRPVWLFCSPDLAGLYRQVGFLEAKALPGELEERLERYRRHQQLIALQF